jgi:hypothetical protein
LVGLALSLAVAGEVGGDADSDCGWCEGHYCDRDHPVIGDRAAAERHHRYEYDAHGCQAADYRQDEVRHVRTPVVHLNYPLRLQFERSQRIRTHYAIIAEKTPYFDRRQHKLELALHWNGILAWLRAG